jgi:hypothetical protein
MKYAQPAPILLKLSEQEMKRELEHLLLQLVLP